MCNLSQGILEEGRVEGKAEGKAEERLLTTLHYVKKQMQKNNLSAEEAMNLLDVDNDIRPKILEEINEYSEDE